MNIPSFLKNWWERFLFKAKIIWEKLVHQEAKPSQIGLGFALGVFVSFLPIFPLQTVAGLALAFVLRSNKVAMLTGLHCHLLVLPFIPFVFYTEFKIGKKLLHVRGRLPNDGNIEYTVLSNVRNGWDILQATFIGGLIIGVPVAFICYFIVEAAARKWQKLKVARELYMKNDKPPLT